MGYSLESLFRDVTPEPVDDGWLPMHGREEPEWASPEEATRFAEWVQSFQFRPWDWVLACYPWGEPGSPLEKRVPEPWQREFLQHLQHQLQTRVVSQRDVMNLVLRYSTATGHGTGKTTLVAWLIHWFMSTHPNGEAVITASTEAQLQTKTWRELNKWQALAINGWMFEWTATAYKHRDAPATWFAKAQAWSESNSQSFAGTHEKYVLVIFDEASGIHPAIWEVVNGAFTTGICYFFAFGNPTETSGGFYDTWHKLRRRYYRFRVDSRHVSFANQEEIAGWIEDHGEDSDWIRRRVLGKFPRAAETQFIGHDLVHDAQQRTIEWRDIPASTPRLMGVDCARSGADNNVIVIRQGRKMHNKVIRWKQRDLMKTATFISGKIREFQPDMVFVDVIGIGAGVVDRLRQLGHDNIVEVCSGETPTDPVDKQVYANMRIVMWARMREWLKVADIPDDADLETDLTGPTYYHQKRTEKELLESKQEMKARGMDSPDTGDALAHTFWEKLPIRRGHTGRSLEPEHV